MESIKRFLSGYGLYVLVFMALLPAMILRDFNPDNELRYISIAGEALDNGTFFAFTNHGVAYADKPPLYLWICMLGRALFGTGCLWFISLFSVLPAFVVTEVMARWTASELSRKWQLSARLMLLTSVLFLGLTLTLRMDMLMTMFIVLSLRVFARMYSGDNSRRLAWLFPIYVFLGLFTKGPYGLLLPFFITLCFLGYKHRLREAGRWWGWRNWLIIAGLSAIWLGAVFAEGGTAYLDNLLVKQTVGRAVNSFTHDEPVYYYFISVWYSLAPWSIFALGALIAGLCMRRTSRSNGSTLHFFVTAISVTYVVLSAVSSKLAVYLLPAFPFIIYAGCICASRIGDNVWLKISLIIPLAALACAPVALAIASRDIPEADTAIFYIAAGLMSASAICGIVLLFVKGRGIPAGVGVAAAGMLLMLFTAGIGIDTLNPYIGFRDMASQADAAASRCGVHHIYTYHVSRPQNLDVYLRTPFTILEDKPDGTKPAMPAPGSGILLKRTKDVAPEDDVVGHSGKYSIIQL